MDTCTVHMYQLDSQLKEKSATYPIYCYPIIISPFKIWLNLGFTSSLDAWKLSISVGAYFWAVRRGIRGYFGMTRHAAMTCTRPVIWNLFPLLCKVEVKLEMAEKCRADGSRISAKWTPVVRRKADYRQYPGKEKGAKEKEHGVILTTAWR